MSNRRERNPVPESSRAAWRRTVKNLKPELKRAVELYQDFRGDDPEYIDTVEVHDYGVFMVIGYLDFVGYHTVRDGEDERYIHHFKAKSRPLLCCSHDGKQLIILGGEYKFGERGIIG